MKNTLNILVLFIGSITFCNAQDFSQKYGKVTADELKMTTYDNDTSAVAVVLNEDITTDFYYNESSGFQLITSLNKKIKILKQEGTTYGTIIVPYYSKLNSDADRISGLEAKSYNIDKGEIVKTDLQKNYIYTEDVSDRYKRLKFSLPNVKAGTVIEYKYKITSNRYGSIPDWEPQTDIPVMNSTYHITIPEYFIYNVEVKGYSYISNKETRVNQQFHCGRNNDGTLSIVTSVSRDIVFSVKDLPALKEDEFVWCIDDYRSGVSFELSGTNFPGSFYKSYSNSWNDIVETLRKELDFDKYIRITNPFKDETKNLIDTVSDKLKRTKLIYDFIKKHIKWNGEYSFMRNSPKNAVKNGTGDNAQINVILMSILNDAGINAYPVLISLRSSGRLPITHPSIDKLSTFIVAADITDSTAVYLDGSAVNGGLNELPSDLRVNKGYLYTSTHESNWIDLSNLTKNEQRFNLIAQLGNDGLLNGSIFSAYSNQKAYSYKISVKDDKDSTERIVDLQNDNQIKIDSVKVFGKEPISNIIKEKIYFTRQFDINGDYIYINPMILTHIKKNNFTRTERQLPVEFDYPYNYSGIYSILLPDNYDVVELPKSQYFKLDNNSGGCLYQIVQQANTIQLKYIFELNQTIFPSTDYNYLRDFYGKVATKNAEMIVLKKKQS
jgi:hypothetical protein